MELEPAQRTAITYRWELLRAPAAGVLESASTVFLLLIAVRAYDAGPLAKALVAGGGSLGLLLAPLLVRFVESRRWPVAQAAAGIVALGAISFLMMAAFPIIPVYVAGCVLGLTTFSSIIPLLTQMYQENYPVAERGRRFSRTMMLRIGAAALFSDLAGRGLSGHIERYCWLLVVFATAAAFTSLALSRCPSRPLTAVAGTHPFHAFRFLRTDRVFRMTIVSWIFLGFGTLMMLPLRVEYLANPRYGLRFHGEPLTAGMVTLFAGVIPNLARLVLNPVWGALFDRMNFFVLRITLNVGFVLGLVAFFVSGSVSGLVIGGILVGVSNAGADVAWSLWVTKFAPPDRVADYMSVHTFFTGSRALIAPLAAFYLVARLSMPALGWLSAALIAIASAFLIPEIRTGKSPRPAAPLVEEVTD